ncbi:hypothetical protein ETH_00003700 [Eimeria tenella]|uniref:Uncharacterized protein n=1 Tax=Eimeria tenella TaxID=5802 RepID=U6KNV3_EIMTE|nr:hypothetical protein ETH_00003700 [Eimeria tenella]CDJ39656.1 hypothetical protein ETH_00003700 [Eimeria tenella]|eukprot:XP_013230411.1 hypothetical protein ETH_00003700 [Eimeria tenella]
MKGRAATNELAVCDVAEETAKTILPRWQRSSWCSHGERNWRYGKGCMNRTLPLSEWSSIKVTIFVASLFGTCRKCGDVLCGGSSRDVRVTFQTPLPEAALMEVFGGETDLAVGWRAFVGTPPSLAELVTFSILDLRRASGHWITTKLCGLTSTLARFAKASTTLSWAAIQAAMQFTVLTTA